MDDKKRKPRFYYTKETLSKEASKYKTRKDFKINDSGAYSTAVRMKILDEICSHMIQFRKPNGYWTKERCKDEALKFTKRVDFENGSGGAYNFATRNKWMDEICSHMKYTGNKVIRLVYVYEFIDKHVYVGLTYNIDIRNESHKSGKKNSSMYEHMLKTGLIPKLTFSEYMDVDKAKLLEETTVKSYKNNGYTILNKVKTGALGGSTLVWTFEKCCEEALKYEFRSEFQKKSNGAYDASWNNKWLDKVCSHMKLKKKPDGYWTLEKCKEEALKYSSCTEFDKKAPGAYKATKKNGWISEVCSHLKTRPRKNKKSKQL